MHVPVLNEVPLPGRGDEYEYETEAGLSTELKSGGPLLRETYRHTHTHWSIMNWKREDLWRSK